MFSTSAMGQCSWTSPMNKVKKPRFLKLDSPQESLVWTLRLMFSDINEFPRTYKDMLEWDTDPAEGRLRIMTAQTWSFLRPFFASRGYTLYEQKDERLLSEDLIPKASPVARVHDPYPYSRLVTGDDYPILYWFNPSIWGARDRCGRDVVIKFISDVSNPSDELKVMQRLNEKELRSDPHNHTIHALEFITFDEFVFVVMPRWDMAWFAEFAVVSELMEITKTFLELFAFLHRNKIVHHDFLGQNTGMNTVRNLDDLTNHKGLRNAGEVRYTLYDFGYSIAYPKDCVPEDLVATRRLYFEMRGLPSVEGPYNPFKADLALMAGTLQPKVRHIENIVPGLGPLFDSMVNPLDPNQLTAAQALSKFMEIYEALTNEQLRAPVKTWLWKNGRSFRKSQY